MTTILVERMILILEIFRSQKSQESQIRMTKNQICVHTGIKNKTPTLVAINMLVKDKILVSEKVNKQKEIITVTPLGQEIIDLITEINVANEAHTALALKISEYETLVEKSHSADQEGKNYDKVLKRKLLQKGWNDEDIESFNKVMEGICRIEKIYRKNICNCLLHRYSVILPNFKGNGNAGEILTRIILKQVVHVLGLGAHYYNTDIASEYSFDRFEDLSLAVQQEIDLEFSSELQYRASHVVLNRFTSSEAINLMSSLLSIARINRNRLETALSRVDNEIGLARKFLRDRRIKDVDSKTVRGVKLMLETWDQLRQIYCNCKPDIRPMRQIQ